MNWEFIAYAFAIYLAGALRLKLITIPLSAIAWLSWKLFCAIPKLASMWLDKISKMYVRSSGWTVVVKPANKFQYVLYCLSMVPSAVSHKFRSGNFPELDKVDDMIRLRFVRDEPERVPLNWYSED
jgi:hypothetical protein